IPTIVCAVASGLPVINATRTPSRMRRSNKLLERGVTAASSGRSTIGDSVPSISEKSPSGRRLRSGRRGSISVSGSAFIGRFFHPRTHLLRTFRRYPLGKLFVVHTGHIDEDIDSVEQWAGYPMLVAGDGRIRTAAAAARVAPVPTRAGVHR